MYWIYDAEIKAVQISIFINQNAVWDFEYQSQKQLQGSLGIVPLRELRESVARGLARSRLVGEHLQHPR